MAQFGIRGDMGGLVEFNEIKYMDGSYSTQAIIDSIFPIITVESRGLYGQDHEYKKSESDKGWIFEMEGKVVKTNSSAIEKQAYAVYKIEEYANIPTAQQINFDEYQKIDILTKMKDFGFPKKDWYGKLKKGKFSRVQDMMNGYNNYLYIINGVK